MIPEGIKRDEAYLEELLENRTTAKLIWEDPRPAIGPEGNELHADITHSATVQDCINMARYAAKQRGQSAGETDLDLLQDFITVNWAWSEGEEK